MSDTLTNALRDATRTSGQYGIQPIATVNPLAGMGSAMDMVGKIQGLDKTLAERNAGQAFLNSIDPQTGKPNQALLMQNLRGDPSTAYAAQQAAQRGQTLDADTYKLHNERLGAMHSAAAQLIADNPNGVPQDEINRVIQNQVTLGNIQPQEAEAARATFGADPRRNTQTLLQGLGRNISAQTALEASRPPIGQVDTGPGYQGFQRQSPMSSAPPTGAITPSGGIIRKDLDPATATDMVDVKMSDGTPKQVARGELSQWLQDNPGATVAPLGGNQGRTGNGRYPAPAQPAQSTPGPAPFTGQSPSVLAANKADSEQYLTDRTAVPAHYQNINTLQNARSALEQARTGKGIAPFQTLMSVINTIAPGWTPEAGKTQAEQYALAQKYLTDYARSSGAATHSDAQLAAAQHANPSVDIPNMAARDVVNYQIGRERQAIAQTLETPDKATGAGHGQHAASFAGKTDPRGFAWDVYTDEERASIAKSVADNKQAKERLARSIAMGRRVPGLAATPAPASSAPPAPAPDAPAPPAPPPVRPAPQVPTGD